MKVEDNMKKLFRITLVAMAVVMLNATTVFATPPTTNVEPFNLNSEYTFDELKLEFEKALKNGDHDMLEHIGEKATELLSSENTMLYYPNNKLQPTSIQRVDPDSSYYLSLFPNYFSHGYYRMREGYRTITLYPRRIILLIDLNKAWNSVVAKFTRLNYWNYSTQQTIKDQFVCHAMHPATPIGYTGSDWNLEIDKTSINWAICN